MKVLVVLSLVAAACASLEPAGYRPPGSAPSARYLPSNDYVATPSNVYLPAAQTSASSSRYSEAPAAPARNYLPSRNSGYRNAAEENYEQPAKYEFHYEVKDNYDNDFGHQESRDGDAAHGMYFVLLPDGRKQIVEYTADHEGYKPRISYEEPRQGYSAAYNRQGAQAQGYPQGPY